MSTPRQRRIWSSRFLIASFALAAPGFVSSQATSTEIQTIAPSVVANSIHASRYGSASDCPRGFVKVAAACQPHESPSYAPPRGTVRGHFEAAFKVTPQFALLSETGACAQ